MANQTVTLYPDQIIGSYGTWVNNFFESNGGASGIFFGTGTASAPNGQSPGTSAYLQAPATQTSPWLGTSGIPVGTKYIFVPHDTTGKASALFSACGFTDNWSSTYNPYWNYFTVGATQTGGGTVPTYRQIRGIQTYTVFGTNAIAAYASSVPPSVQLIMGSIGTAWGYNPPGSDSISSTLIGDVSNGASSAGISTGGITGQLFSQIGKLLPTGTFGTSSSSQYQSLRSLVMTDIPNLEITIKITGSGSSSLPSEELRFQSIGLVVTYNDPPVIAGVSAVGQVQGGAPIATTTPTLVWNYTDPEGDQQETYRVLVFPLSSTQVTNFPAQIDLNNVTTSGGQSTLNFTSSSGRAAVAPAVYDSGVVRSNANTLTIPAGILNNYTSYRVFVFCSDVGSNGRYNTAENFGNQTMALSTAVTSGTSPASLVMAAATYGTVIPLGANIRLTDLTTGDATIVVTTAAVTLSTSTTTSIAVTGWPTGGAPTTFATGTSTQVQVLNSGLDLTPEVEPVLMPALEANTTPGSPSSSFIAASGGIGPFATRARLNLLGVFDSDTIGTGSSLTWATDTSFFAGITPTFTYNQSITAGGATWPNVLKITPASNGVLSVAPGYVAVESGTILTAEMKYWCAQAGTRIGIEFYSDPLGVTPIGTSAGVPLSPSMPTNTTANPPTKAYVQARVPSNAVTARVVVYQLAAVTTDPIYITQIALSVNVLSLIDDPSFELTGNSFNQYWITTGTIPNNPTFPSPISYPYSQDDALLTAAQLAHTAYYFALDADTTTNYLFACDATYDGSTAATLTPTFGAGSGAAFSLTPAWSRFTYSLSAALFGSTPATLSFTSNTGTSELDNTQLEMVWPFLSGATGFSGFAVTTGTAVPLQCALGLASSTSAPSHGQCWTAGYASSAATFSNTVWPSSGTSSYLSLTIPVTAAIGSNYVEQIFTVSGYSAISLSWAWANYYASLGATIQFFDSSGIQLSQSQVAGTLNSPVTIGTQAAGTTVLSGSSTYTTATSGSIAVPTNAAYARIAFTATSASSTITGAGYITNVVLTPTGTLSPSTPWMDGGWSAGGIIQSETTFGLPLELDLNRSPSPWLTPNPYLNTPSGSSIVRIPPNQDSAGADLVLSSNLEADFTDYEYPATDLYTSQSVYYFASLVLPDTQLVPPSQPITVTNANSFAPTNWILVDPLVPANNIILQVKKVTFQNDENQSVLMPAGRGRKIVIGDTQIFGDTITMDLQTLTTADYDAMKTQLNKVYPLLLRSPEGEMWYVRLTKRSRERVWQGSYAVPLRTYTITMEQVDAIL